MSNQDVAPFVAAHAAFAEAMALAGPAVRSRVTISIKDEARVALEAEARRINALVRGIGKADAAQLIRLGLTARKTSYSRVGAPTVKPRVTVLSVEGPTMKLIVRDADGLHVALPNDVASLALYQSVGEMPTIGHAGWVVAAQVARARLSLMFDLPMGTPVHFIARYLNRRGEAGPWSEITSTFAMGGMTFGRRLRAA